MQLGIESQIPDGLLAANALLAENSRLGVPTSTHTLHRGFGFVISSTYKGFQFRCYETASDPVVAPSNAPKNDCSVQPATGFMQANAADAATLAGQLGVPTSFVLALSGAESTYGTNHFATQDNNYFGMHAGAYGQAGVSASNPIVARFGAGNGFLLSGASFVHKAKQLLVGVPNPQDPTQFFTAIHKSWGIGTPNYVSQFTGPRGNVAMAAIRMQCPKSK